MLTSLSQIYHYHQLKSSGPEQGPDMAGNDDGLYVMEICRPVSQVDVTRAQGGHRLRD